MKFSFILGVAIKKILDSNLFRIIVYPNQGVRGFPQSLKVHYGTVPRWIHCRFLPKWFPVRHSSVTPPIDAVFATNSSLQWPTGGSPGSTPESNTCGQMGLENPIGTRQARWNTPRRAIDYWIRQWTRWYSGDTSSHTWIELRKFCHVSCRIFSEVLFSVFGCMTRFIITIPLLFYNVWPLWIDARKAKGVLSFGCEVRQ